jgi:hypothetical protein
MRNMISVPLKTFAVQAKVVLAAGMFSTKESPPGITPIRVTGAVAFE